MATSLRDPRGIQDSHPDRNGRGLAAMEPRTGIMLSKIRRRFLGLHLLSSIMGATPNKTISHMDMKQRIEKKYLILNNRFGKIALFHCVNFRQHLTYNLKGVLII